MKRKITLAVAVTTLGALLVVGSTLAWFTDEEKATNTFSTGDVEIVLEENGEIPGIIGESPEYPNGFRGLEFAQVVPGDLLNKVVTVTNTGSVPAYVRIKVQIDPTQVLALDPSLDFNTTDWGLNNGYYYYRNPLAVGATTTALFTNVTIPTTWDSASYENLSFQVLLDAQAIQAKNITVTTPDDGVINGWRDFFFPSTN